jgi:hypothetical protein
MYNQLIKQSEFNQGLWFIFGLYYATFVKIVDLYYSVYPGPLRPLGGVIFIAVGFYYTVLPFVPF